MPSSGQSDFRELLQFGVFHVPEYQRYYSWTRSEIDDLWTDLTTVPVDRNHYFGTFIVQDKGEQETVETGGYTQTKSDDIYLLIDGQQRLTTIALLGASLAEHLEEVAPETDSPEQIKEDAEQIRQSLLVDEGLYKITLLDQKEDDYFKRIIDGESPLPEPTRPSHKRLNEAKEGSDDWKGFDDRLDSKREEIGDNLEFARWCRDLWEDNIRDLETMVYVIDAGNPEKSTLIFDSVNDRGRDLSTLDKTKSFLMRMGYLSSTNLEDEDGFQFDPIRRRFGKMYDHHQNIVTSPYGEDVDDDDIQRYHLLADFNWTQKEEHQSSNLLDTLKTHVRNLQRKDAENITTETIEFVETYTNNLEHAFKDLDEILNYRNGDNIESLIERIHRLRHATKFYPALVKTWDRFDNSEREDLLRTIETFIVRLYALGNHRTYTGRAKLYTRTRKMPDDATLEQWQGMLKDIITDYEGDDQFRRTLIQSDLGSSITSKDLRYLFHFYNKERAEEEGEPGTISLNKVMGEDYTVEHIWPKTPDEYPFDDSGEFESVPQRYEAYKNRLGNLTLASKSWNSTWGNEPFDKKTEDGYQESNLWVQKDIPNRYPEWTVENIEKREQRLIEFALQKWSLPDVPIYEP